MWEDGRLGAVWGLQRLAHVIYFTEMVNVVVQISFPQTPFTRKKRLFGSVGGAKKGLWGQIWGPGRPRTAPEEAGRTGRSRVGKTRVAADQGRI